ncbi:uncharacterized protein TRAVEDRAFT_170761 [Trametes versicolor FP-101664 SS1]|uniref:uncharacterized protein n=1 Tax=Trametes versicolor (strain FP-101664) TaxID=717944 RepID=UPI0004623E31|nr:uncharacterized protein TRAVEDRAFT_170761 [Trametes versicolor FP-101664 SS1]EIW56790.1 hypothetical protein TRAVEDRAFT_170761 [Trametes versicolor FP-101664 SS1]
MSTTTPDASDAQSESSTPTETTSPEPTAVDELEPETPKDTGPTSPLPDDEFWLEDGNLTLIAGDVEFRVYKGPLIANSPVFRDMLSLPQPIPTQPDDRPDLLCPCGYAPALVHVSDSPEDLRHLLRVLVPGKTPWVVPEDPTFSAISACIRLGHKYEIDVVVQRSLDYLKKHFAESFDTWARVDPPRPPAFQGVHSIGVVNLARMTNTDVLLPTALMNCCMLDATDLVHGFAREDGTAETLSADDLGRCFLGRAALMQANTLATLALFNQTLAEGCTRREVCAPVFLRLLDELRNHEKVVCTLDWYKYWSDYIDGRDDDRRLCTPCYKMLLEREKQQHREIWRRLPELMGVTVEGWAADLQPVLEPVAPEDI